MLSTDAKNQIISKLAEFNIICNHFTCIVDLEKSYPDYVISATLHGIGISLKLISCVLDSSANILGIKLSPDGSNQGEIVSFTVSLHTNDLTIVNHHIKHKYVEQQLTLVAEVNKDFPFDVDYQVALYYESFCLLTGTLSYENFKYDIHTIADNPSFLVGAFIENFSSKFKCKGQLLLRVRQNGEYSTYDGISEKNRNIEDLKLRIFRVLLFYHMKKTTFRLNTLTIDEISSLHYADLLNYITVQKMADI